MSEEFEGWPKWFEQELAANPNDEVVLAMKELWEYRPESDFSLDEDQIKRKRIY